MEEDIKILEDMLNKESSIYKRNRRGNKEIKFEVNSNYYNAIENLIAGYKQLEEENKTLKNFTSDIFNEDITKEFIRKDKVKEVINSKCKAFQHRSSIEKILECEFKRLEEELLGEE